MDRAENKVAVCSPNSSKTQMPCIDALDLKKLRET